MTQINFSINWQNVRYSGELNNAEFKVKIGFRKWVIPTSSITGFYTGEVLNGNVITVAYAKDNKVKAVKIFFDKGDSGAEELLNGLRTIKGNAEVKGTSLKEAYKLMGVKESSLFTVIVLVNLVVTALLLVIFLPGIIHMLDKGHQVITADEIATGTKLETKNLNIKGMPLGDCLLELSIKRNNSNTKRYLMPIVGEGWLPAKPVSVIASFNEKTFENIVGKTEFEGMVKNVLWESGNLHKDFFSTKCGLKISDNAFIFDLEKENNSYFIVLLIAILLVVDASVGGLILFFRSKGKTIG